MATKYTTPRTHKRCPYCCGPDDVLPIDQFRCSPAKGWNGIHVSTYCKSCAASLKRGDRLKPIETPRLEPAWNSFRVLPPLPEKVYRGPTQPPLFKVHVNGTYLNG